MKREIIAGLIIWATFGSFWSVSVKLFNGKDSSVGRSLLIGFLMASGLVVFAGLLCLAVYVLDGR